MWSKIKIGESQIPQILVMVVGLVFMIMFQFRDNPAYVIVTLICLQASCVMMAVYDEREDEKKANEEAFALLDTPHRTYEVKRNG